MVSSGRRRPARPPRPDGSLASGQRRKRCRPARPGAERQRRRHARALGNAAGGDDRHRQLRPGGSKANRPTLATSAARCRTRRDGRPPRCPARRWHRPRGLGRARFRQGGCAGEPCDPRAFTADEVRRIHPHDRGHDGGRGLQHGLALVSKSGSVARPLPAARQVPTLRKPRTPPRRPTSRTGPARYPQVHLKPPLLRPATARPSRGSPLAGSAARPSPIPPALATAIARLAGHAPAIGAIRIGISTPIDRAKVSARTRAECGKCASWNSSA